MLLDLIAGARPNFMKIAPIIDALERRRASGGAVEYRFIHTGQHYDSSMSSDILKQLGIPHPHINLEVGPGTQAEQVGKIMVRYEQVIAENPSQLCVVVGDVNSTLACAIVARKAGIPVAHVEGGIRSWDWGMPEEINRVVTDSVTNLFFTTSETANQNLRTTGVRPERIHFVGNTMIDTLLKQLPELRPPEFWERLELSGKKYLVVTLHRPSNVDSPEKLFAVLEAIAKGADGWPVVFPVHPRTASALRDADRRPAGIHYVQPQGYLEFNYLVRHAAGVITDSGGVTEETTVLGVPCITMRDSTERPETVEIGTNELIGSSPERLPEYLGKLRAGTWKQGRIPEKWDGKASERIVEIIEARAARGFNV